MVNAESAKAMAAAVRGMLGGDVGLATTRVTDTSEQSDQPIGTVWLGVALDAWTNARVVRWPGDRERLRQFAAISLLDFPSCAEVWSSPQVSV